MMKETQTIILFLYGYQIIGFFIWGSS